MTIRFLSALLLLSLMTNFAVVSARADEGIPGYGRSPGGILMPRSSLQAGSYSEFSDFEADFCAANDVANSLIKQICFGRLRLQNQVALASRAFLMTDAAGERALFVESEIPGVELRTVEFGIIGPLNKARLSVAAEVGRVRLSLDFRGEVSSVEMVTKKWGRLKATRH
jgi:hypothetical protein